MSRVLWERFCSRLDNDEGAAGVVAYGLAPVVWNVFSVENDLRSVFALMDEAVLVDPLLKTPRGDNSSSTTLQSDSES